MNNGSQKQQADLNHAAWPVLHKQALLTLASLTRQTCSNRSARHYTVPRIVVAIPVRNEIERMVRCLDALDSQHDAFGHPLAEGSVKVVLLTNGCTDGTYAALAENIDQWRVAIDVIDITLPLSQRSAGYARYLANHAAIHRLPEDGGLLFMTDADSCVPPDWIATYASLLQSGYDAVAGTVDLHPDDCSEIPAPLKHRCQAEDRYTQLLDELEHCIDPVEHDPWPRHYSASGANIAVRAEAIPVIGDFPQIACGEDKALARRLEAFGCRVRHECGLKVHTSGRLFGRAAGGMADTLRHRLKTPGTACDERLESADAAFRRARLRHALRDTFARGVPTVLQIETIFADFKLEVPRFAALTPDTHFETFWQPLEQTHPQLVRRAITPSRLAVEIPRAEALLAEVRGRGQPLSVPHEEEQLA